MNKSGKFVVTMFVITMLLNVISCKPMTNADTKKRQVSHSFACIASQHACEKTTGLGDFTVQFSGELAQGKLKTELPFYIRLKFKGAKNSYKLQKVESFMEGKDMFMGKVPVFFNVSSDNNAFIAKTLLASCSEEVMTWRLWFTVNINIEDNIKQQRFFIDFDSQRL